MHPGASGALTGIITPLERKISWKQRKSGLILKKQLEFIIARSAGSHISWVFQRHMEEKTCSGSLLEGSSPVSTPGFQGRHGWRCMNAGKPERLFFFLNLGTQLTLFSP